MHWFPPVKRLCPGQKLQCESSPMMFSMVCTNLQDPAGLSRPQTDGITKTEIDASTLFLLCLDAHLISLILLLVYFPQTWGLSRASTWLVEANVRILPITKCVYFGYSSRNWGEINSETMDQLWIDAQVCIIRAPYISAQWISGNPGPAGLVFILTQCLKVFKRYGYLTSPYSITPVHGQSPSGKTQWKTYYVYIWQVHYW